MERQPRGRIGKRCHGSQGSVGYIRIAWSQTPKINGRTTSCEDRTAIESAQKPWCLQTPSGEYKKSLPATGEGSHSASVNETLHRNWNIPAWACTEHSQIADWSDLPSVRELAASSHMGPDHRRNTRQHHSRNESSRNLPGISGQPLGGHKFHHLPSRPACEGLWKADIDKRGSDLAKRPSEKALANRDSSGSEKSNDSSSIKGV